MSISTATPTSVDRVVVRFAGDSGDGMQLTGTEFTRAAALAGNDIATFPDFPAEIRAPAGTLAGVSGFQLHFAADSIYTPGDAPDVLVAMNPAAFKVNIDDLKPGGLLIVNTDAFSKANLKKAGYAENPLDALDGPRVVKVPMRDHVKRALDGLGLGTKDVDRTKNFWALGLMYWLYSRPIERQLEWIQTKFAKKPTLAEANIRAFRAGHAYGETAELSGETYVVPPAAMAPGKYRRVTGNSALAMGLVAGAHKAGLPLFLGSYPITPASDILHELSRYKHFGVTTFQAEDEIAAIGAAIGASYGGVLSVTTTSGPGLALKGEAAGLALILETPLIIVNVQRAGPSTGMPTKTEQSDLLQALYGRNGDAPLAVLAAQSPADCFDAAVEAARYAVQHMCPVILLSDGYLANGAEPWRMPAPDDIAPIDPKFRTDPEGYQPYARDEDTLARAWVKPGTPGLESQLGGLEKDALTGYVSYDQQNHQHMTNVRREKIQRIADHLPPTTVHGDAEGDVLFIGWGGTYGAIHQAVRQKVAEGKKVAQVHLRWLNPLPKDLGDIMARFKKVVVAELNDGQLWRVLRAEYLVDAEKLTKVMGRPFSVGELCAAIDRATESVQ